MGVLINDNQKMGGGGGGGGWGWVGSRKRQKKWSHWIYERFVTELNSSITSGSIMKLHNLQKLFQQLPQHKRTHAFLHWHDKFSSPSSRLPTSPRRQSRQQWHRPAHRLWRHNPTFFLFIFPSNVLWNSNFRTNVVKSMWFKRRTASERHEQQTFQTDVTTFRWDVRVSRFESWTRLLLFFVRWFVCFQAEVRGRCS